MALPGLPSTIDVREKHDPEPMKFGIRTLMEESAHAQLMVPDILMPVQYYDGMRRGNLETQAIKRLLFAVLADAVRCFQSYADAQSRAGRRIFGEAPMVDFGPQ
jgi:hypothetical protein